MKLDYTEPAGYITKEMQDILDGKKVFNPAKPNKTTTTKSNTKPATKKTK